MIANVRPPLPVYAWIGLEPPAPPRYCSRGCHALPSTAKFDPHTGASLAAGVRAKPGALPRLALQGS
jgi:hypothetical protein